MKVWREVPPTLLTVAGLTLALSVTQGWNWPLLGDAHAGIIALGLVGFGACVTSAPSAMGFSIKDPFVIAAMVAGIVVLAAGVIGLFVNTLSYLVVMMAATAALWLVATARHLVERGAGTAHTSTLVRTG
jgi:hypothetical protein